MFSPSLLLLPSCKQARCPWLPVLMASWHKTCFASLSFGGGMDGAYMQPRGWSLGSPLQGITVGKADWPSQCL